MAAPCVTPSQQVRSGTPASDWADSLTPQSQGHDDLCYCAYFLDSKHEWQRQRHQPTSVSKALVPKLTVNGFRSVAGASQLSGSQLKSRNWNCSELHMDECLHFEV